MFKIKQFKLPRVGWGTRIFFSEECNNSFRVGQKIRVGWENGNTHIILFGLI